jgi:hypothetical protein
MMALDRECLMMALDRERGLMMALDIEKGLIKKKV